ncbi:TonB-dependent receptor [Marinomonas transparens]|uniref:TonB-dependent receptor n=1 Tax=Marinomonas transparens TaxID=2795388 RepID=A0A934JXV5_9GAMM|nr:TonB-dependent receptor [Marinomonas transparens]MBJ7538947.1 TonB-dependent receptor [Marinomonas transparens]
MSSNASIRLIKRRSTLTLLAASIAFAGGLTTPIVYAESAAVTSHYYKIPAGSLAQAVNSFAAMSGMFLGGSGELLSGKRTLGFEGEYSTAQALDLLLAGTGLSYKKGDGNSIVLIDANIVTKSEDGITMSPLLVRADREITTLGKNVISASEIESMAGDTSNLTDLLKGNGSVRYSRSASSSANSASMRPDEVSINGQSHYQNSFIIDGMSANNDLNPGDSEDTYSNPISPTNLSMLSGSSSQSYYVDPEALGSVTVYDSNIPVEFGGFLGGVIESELKRYDGEDYLSFKYGISRDEWDQMHVDDSLVEEMNDGDSIEGEYTPNFLKQRYTITGAQGITDKLGMTFTASRGRSNFDQSYVKNIGSSIYGKQGKAYDDTIDNMNARFDYDANQDLHLTVSMLYANRYHDGITNASYDSSFVKLHQAAGIVAKSTYKAPLGTLIAKLSYDQAKDALDSDDSTYTYHYVDYYNGNWPYSGGYGDINQQQNRSEFKLDWVQNAFNVGDYRHVLHTGIELGYKKQFYQVDGDIVNENYQCINSGCADNNSDGVIDYGDEYLRVYSIIEANKFEKESHSVAAYLEDTISIGNWAYNFGARVDYGSTLENTDLSPRTSMMWDVFGDQGTQAIAGTSRYYGRDFFRYEVNSTLRSWRSMYRYNTDSTLNRETTYTDNSFYDYDLDTPYSDELSFIVKQRLGVMDATLKYVNRETRDQVSRDKTEDGLDYYSNDGRSSTDTVSLKLETREPITLGSTLTHLEFMVSHQKSESNSLSDVAYEDEVSSDEIYYKGDVIYESQLPRWDFNIPFSVFFSTETQIPSWNLVWDNAINVDSGGKIAQDTQENYTDLTGTYDVYEDLDFDTLITLDTAVTWTPSLFKDIDGYIKISVDNVFDDYIDKSTSSGTFSYTLGRSFSLDVGMRF